MKKTSVTLIPLLTISLAATTFALTNTAQACTSLLYKDANGAPYAGRNPASFCLHAFLRTF